VTEADLKRARFFGLTIPKPAPVVARLPQPIVAEVAPEIPAANPRDSWPAWCDELAYTIADEAPAPPASGGELSDLELSQFASRIATVGDDAPNPVYPMPALPGPVVARPELVGLPPADAPMAWVATGGHTYQMFNVSPVRADYPRARRPRFEPTAEEMAEAALLFADNRSSCLEGESAPPLGRPSRPPVRRPAWVGVNNTTDADNWPGGVC
jgi:hypothetical protein